MTRFEIVESRFHKEVQFRSVIARDGDKHLRFSLWNDSPVLGSFSGNCSPSDFPDAFEHFGDPGVLNYRSWYRLKAEHMEGLFEAEIAEHVAKTEC